MTLESRGTYLVINAARPREEPTNAMLLDRLPSRDPDQLVVVMESDLRTSRMLDVARAEDDLARFYTDLSFRIPKLDTVCMRSAYMRNT
jgi:hypothetical protein